MVSDNLVWTSHHLYLMGSGDRAQEVFGVTGDALVCDLIAPTVADLVARGLIDHWFFIRYRDERGPHLRLRLAANRAHRGEVEDQLRRRCDEYGPGLELCAAEYEPEYGRYGGEHLIGFSEQIFASSSRLALLALSELRRTEGDPNVRYGMTVAGLLVLLGGLLGNLDPGDVRTLLVRYADATLAFRHPERTVAQTREEFWAVAKGQTRLHASLGPVFSAAWSAPRTLPEGYREEAITLAGLRSALTHAAGESGGHVRGRNVSSGVEAVIRLTGSHLHMHMNRAGIVPAHEPLVVLLAAQILERARDAA